MEDISGRNSIKKMLKLARNSSYTNKQLQKDASKKKCLNPKNELSRGHARNREARKAHYSSMEKTFQPKTAKRKRAVLRKQNTQNSNKGDKKTAQAKNWLNLSKISSKKMTRYRRYKKIGQKGSNLSMDKQRNNLIRKTFRQTNLSQTQFYTGGVERFETPQAPRDMRDYKRLISCSRSKEKITKQIGTNKSRLKALAAAVKDSNPANSAILVQTLVTKHLKDPKLRAGNEGVLIDILREKNNRTFAYKPKVDKSECENYFGRLYSTMDKKGASLESEAKDTQRRNQKGVLTNPFSLTTNFQGAVSKRQARTGSSHAWCRKGDFKENQSPDALVESFKVNQNRFKTKSRSPNRSSNLKSKKIVFSQKNSKKMNFFIFEFFQTN